MIIAYLLILLSVLVWTLLVLGNRCIPAVWRTVVSIVGSICLLFVCFTDMLPEVYDQDAVSPLLCGITVLIGLAFQLGLEYIIPHSHHGHGDEHGTTVSSNLITLMCALCIHAFFEGMALVSPQGEVDQPLLIGIMLHNIPLSLLLVSLANRKGYKFWHVFLLLTIFGMAGPLGSTCNLTLLPSDTAFQTIVISFVCGIILHVALDLCKEQISQRTDE